MKLHYLLLACLCPFLEARTFAPGFARDFPPDFPPDFLPDFAEDFPPDFFDKRGNGQKPPRKEKTPEQQRTELLKKLKINRTPSGILEARLKFNRNQEAAAKKKVEKKQQPIGPEDKKTANRKKLAQYKKDIEALRLNVILGRWPEVTTLLKELPDQDAQTAFASIVSSLGSDFQVSPRQELASIGAPGHKQNQYLRPAEIIALSDAAKQTPEDEVLENLAQLINRDNRPPQTFFDTLKKGTRYFGDKDHETKHRTAKFLIDAGYLKEAVPFLPATDFCLKEKKYASLNLLARFHAEAHNQNLDKDRGKTHLPKAWELCLGLIGEKKAPLNQRGQALYRALSLVPELKDETGQTWLRETFKNTTGEGFEILAAVGTLTSQTRNHRSENFRHEQLKLQEAAVSALLGQKNINLTDWKETLTLYAINWNEEAERTQSLTNSSSGRMQREWDDYGNMYYVRRSMDFRGKGPRPISAGDLLDVRPSGKWLQTIDEQVRLLSLSKASRLFLKVKEEDKALPLLKEFAATRPEKAKDLVRELIRVWAENNNPNQENQYRDSYSYYWGYNQRAETIPLTRSKQERNLKKLGELVSKIHALGLDETFQEEFASAFMQCHSQAEVWRLETLATVFGKLTEADPGILATLLSRMRVNLVNLWPNPKVQKQAKTKRTDKELHAQILHGYANAIGLCQQFLQVNDHWKIQTQLAALQYEESNYKSNLKPQPDHAATKTIALESLGEAAQTYIKTLPLEDQADESIDAFTNWFYGALGSPELSALKAKHQPIPSELAKIKEALHLIPSECRQRHLDQFAKIINKRVANVAADLKYRYLEAALPIIGEHKEIEDAANIFQYYQDLVTEIELETRIDGSDQIKASEPFGLYVNIRHTQEIERESGGFQRYLINQNNQRWGYNYGRPQEDYRDKFEKAAQLALEEHFEVISLTFHNSKIESRTDPEHGWRYTPYAYFLLKPKGPEIDSIPPLRIDLDFLDTSGYVVLPITSAAIPIDASVKESPRPYRDLKLILTVDEREAEKENQLFLEIRSTAHGLIPELDQLIKLPLVDYDITATEDRELQIEELDATTEDGAPLASHEWRLTLKPKGEHLPADFTFPEILATTAKEEGLTLQKYEDVDLVSVEPTFSLGAGKEERSYGWLIILTLLVLCAIAYLIARLNQKEEIMVTGPELPHRLTPVTLISFLKKLTQHQNVGEKHHEALGKTIEELQSRSFSAKATPHSSEELEKIAQQWQQIATS